MSTSSLRSWPDATTADHPPPFRVAVVADEKALPRWLVRSIEVAIAAARMQVVAIVEAGTRSAAAEAWSPVRALYSRFERLRFRPSHEPFESIPLSTLAPADDVPFVAVAGAGDGAAEVVEMLRPRNIDLVLNASTWLSTDALAAGARIGAMSLALSDHDRVGQTSDGVQAVLEGADVVRARAELYRSSDGQRVHVVDVVTNAHPFSAGVTRASSAIHAVPLLERMLRDLTVPGAVARDNGVRSAPTPDVRVTPHARPSLLALARLSARYARHVVRGRRFTEQWELAFARVAPEQGNAPDTVLHHYTGLRPPADRFWADPFPLRVDGREYILFEELVYARNIGHISVVALDAHGIAGEAVPVLERPYHLSYPFVFQYEGETYLLPEMCLEGRLELYRATRLPYEWTLDRVMMEGRQLIDATLAEIEGRWWLFACEYEENRGEWNNLVLYHAPSPFGPWAPHQRNPVVTDVRCARPAGRLFQRDGAWYRPAQDCARSYGGAMTIRRILRLSETEYEEEEVLRLDPQSDEGMTGVHTMNAEGGLSVIDRKRLVPRAG